MDNQTDRQAEETVQLAHLLAVAASQIVIDRNHMHALAGQCVEVYRQCRNQRLALTSTHLSNTTLMQAHAADQLHIEMTHAQYTARPFTDYGKSLRQQVIQRFAVRQSFLERIRQTGQLIVRQTFHLWL